MPHAQVGRASGLRGVGKAEGDGRGNPSPLCPTVSPLSSPHSCKEHLSVAKIKVTDSKIVFSTRYNLLLTIQKLSQYDF